MGNLSLSVVFLYLSPMLFKIFGIYRVRQGNLMDSKLVQWSQFLFLLLILFVIIHNNVCHFMCITASSFCLENYAIQILTISLYAFLQSWSCSLSVLPCQGVLSRFHVQSQLSVHELYVVCWWIPSLWGNRILSSQVTEQAMEDHRIEKWQKISRTTAIEALAVWAVALSCWNHMVYWLIPHLSISGIRKLFSMWTIKN
jgi:hypothetical protein